MSERPLYEALMKRAAEGRARFHMPGHKGRSMDGLPLLDISLDFTELDGTGSLYEGIPPISEAERLCAGTWGAEDAFFLTGGSSQGVRAAVFAACRPGGTLICGRDIHSSLAAALVMLDLKCEYIETGTIERFGLLGRIDPAGLERLIEATPDVRGVFITSPSYYGVLQDIPALAAIAKSHGLPLIVDEAHGAHLAFLEGHTGAVASGATLAVCSMHKTLPALGQSALLTSDGKIEPRILRYACQMFGSSSPSYLMMVNMDIVRSFMYNRGRKKQKAVADAVERLSAGLTEGGLDTLASHTPCDPMRLTVSTAPIGLTGREALKILEEDLVSPEMADHSNLVFILSVFDRPEDIQSLSEPLLGLVKRGGPPIPVQQAALPKAVFSMRPREAALAGQEAVVLPLCEGKIASRPVFVFPPGIQLIGPGEKITREHIDYLLLQRQEQMIIQTVI